MNKVHVMTNEPLQRSSSDVFFKNANQNYADDTKAKNKGSPTAPLNLIFDLNGTVYSDPR